MATRKVRPLRIAHVSARTPHPDVADGVAKGLYHLSLAQARSGAEVAVFLLGGDGAQPPMPGVRVSRFRPSLWRFGLPRALREELLGWRPDLFHLHLPYAPENATLARWARRARIPYACSPHGALAPGSMRQRGYLKLPYKYLFELPILNGAAFVHATGDMERLVEYGVRAPLVLVPNGIDLSSIPPDLDTRALARRFPELRERRVFLFLGRLDPDQKGLDLLLDAVATGGLERAALVLLGPDWHGGARRLARRIARMRPPPPVILPGPVHGRLKFDYLAGADVFVHTSRWEGLSHAVLEAAALGLPSLLTRAADPLGRLSGAGAALLVEPDRASISAGLRRLATAGEGELRAMGRRAREVVLAEFTWVRAVSLLTDAYVRYCRLDIASEGGGGG